MKGSALWASSWRASTSASGGECGAPAVKRGPGGKAGPPRRTHRRQNVTPNPRSHAGTYRVSRVSERIFHDNYRRRPDNTPDMSTRRQAGGARMSLRGGERGAPRHGAQGSGTGEHSLWEAASRSVRAESATKFDAMSSYYRGDFDWGSVDSTVRGPKWSDAVIFCGFYKLQQLFKG